MGIYQFRSQGCYCTPQRYLVAWPNGVVKVGETMNGRQRWGAFLNRGAIMLNLGLLRDSLESERAIREYLAENYRPAFKTKNESRRYLPGGGGYLECFLVAPYEFQDLAMHAWYDTEERGGFNVEPGMPGHRFTEQEASL